MQWLPDRSAKSKNDKRATAFCCLFLLLLSVRVFAQEPMSPNIHLLFSADIAYRDEKTFKHPYIQTRIGDHKAAMAIDTGARYNVLFSPFMKQANLPVTPIEGNPNVQNGGNIQMEIGGRVMPALSFFVLEIPDKVTARENLDGLLSGQTFPEDFLLLDFPHRKVIAFSASLSDAEAWLRQKFPRQSLVKTINHTADLYRLSIDGRITGKPPVWIDIDTGSMHTQFQYAYAQDLGPHITGNSFIDIANQTHEMQAISDQTLEFGQGQLQHVLINLDEKTPKPEIPFQGSIGMDVLHKLVLIIPPQSLGEVWIVWP